MNKLEQYYIKMNKDYELEDIFPIDKNNEYTSLYSNMILQYL